MIVELDRREMLRLISVLEREVNAWTTMSEHGHQCQLLREKLKAGLQGPKATTQSEHGHQCQLLREKLRAGLLGAKAGTQELPFAAVTPKPKMAIQKP
jgi:hypothetical protein